MVISQDLSKLIDIDQIYIEPEVRNFKRGDEILAKFPNANLIEVNSHWKIPTLHGNEGSIDRWIKIKRNTLVLGVKKSLSCRPNERSSHFVAPSISNGCSMACSYCYVPRRKGFANPITLFVNIEQISGFIARHAARQGQKSLADQIDPRYWVYDIGENGDCSVDAAIADNVKDLVTLFRNIPNAKASFATKFVNRDLLSYDPQNKTRIRFSLMPQAISKVVDVRTSPIADRISVINDFVASGYEVHLNFSPVIYYDNWLSDYGELFQQIDDTLNEDAKAQLQCEIIFLTHNSQLHDINMQWHPKGEDLLWKPEIQETKYSQTGGRNLRYKRGLKAELVNTFTELLSDTLPYCKVRYAF
jgi:spore photoproduct lyase family protein